MTRIQTPLALVAARFTLGARALRWSTTTALVLSIVIVFTGGVVRVTGSGLGCPTWPTCDATSLATTPELGIHGLIEFANRVFTGVIIFAVAWVIVSARLQKPRVRAMTRLAWSQFWLVLANAIAGGITVLTGLNPWVVALHFLMAIALLTTTTLTWHRARQTGEVGGRGGNRGAKRLSWTLALATLLLILVGTLVSGSGPHSGDTAEVPRMGLDWTTVAVVHGTLGAVVLVLAIVLRFGLGTEFQVSRRRVSFFIAIVLAQGVIGIVQALNGLPDVLVALHLLGAALVWAGALRVVLDVNPRLFLTSQTALPVDLASSGAQGSQR